ncbi:cytokine induced apoptosis inhibitor 1-like protein [Anopheles sinensis]|uniref:Cytokine induced apoptosis inhibitor 1-like protein n=1 Tax=Anopheles sinensis TaxID=74873 RepID=A0A084VEM0_ANOSI|nr:cytokine induced apoptosis inhibitor 1-like protein [Anopheles sinensis]
MFLASRSSRLHATIGSTEARANVLAWCPEIGHHLSDRSDDEKATYRDGWVWGGIGSISLSRDPIKCHRGEAEEIGRAGGGPGLAACYQKQYHYPTQGGINPRRAGRKPADAECRSSSGRVANNRVEIKAEPRIDPGTANRWLDRTKYRVAIVYWKTLGNVNRHRREG